MTDNTRFRSWSDRSVSKLGSTALALAALGCGGSHVSQETLAPAASVGDEPPPRAAAADETAEPEKPARGRIVVRATCAGKPVSAHGRMPIERDFVVDFEMGQEFTAEAGTRHLAVTLTDDTVLIDRPTLDVDVAVEPRKLAKVDLVFPWAKVRLKLLVNGSERPPTTVKLIRKGEEVAQAETGSPAFLVSPGNYEADVPVRGKTVRVKDLVFFEGTDQIVPLRVQR